MLFLDPAYRVLHRDWPTEAVLAVASLRHTAAHHPDDQRLIDLVGQLTIHSDEFMALWKRHPVRSCTSGAKHLHHPTAGPMDLTFETLTLPPPSAPHLIAYTAEAGSASERALRELTQVVPTGHPVRSAER
ncbi:hypothetical protein [Streptomyces bauhiniae]|uniref:MmyB family transcriptional regulator n=1 Tax=Streptomyces bauhiniae TaxID=2340725 RepID=UPI001EF19253|nr:hypothetical protein [Streptomyces bauhiniae]